MDDQQGFSRFRARFESALRAYHKTTGVILANHPLAVHVRGCHCVESVTTLLKCEARGFNNLQRSDRIMQSMEHAVSILSDLSAVAFIGDATGQVSQNA